MCVLCLRGLQKGMAKKKKGKVYYLGRCGFRRLVPELIMDGENPHDKHRENRGKLN